MFAFHLTWDLSYFGYIDPRIVFRPAFKIFAETIGSTFLAVAGVSLVLAHAPRFRARAYLRHLAIIIAAAAAVSLATYIFVPEGFIFFGILHCIALASLIALPFLFLPWWIPFLGAVFVIAAPRVFVSPSFDAPIWWWTGLSTFEPRTNDYWPILPWAGVLLLGVAAMKLGDRFALRERLARWQPQIFSRAALFSVAGTVWQFISCINRSSSAWSGCQRRSHRRMARQRRRVTCRPVVRNAKTRDRSRRYAAPFAPASPTNCANKTCGCARLPTGCRARSGNVSRKSRNRVCARSAGSRKNSGAKEGNRNRCDRLPAFSMRSP